MCLSGGGPQDGAEPRAQRILQIRGQSDGADFSTYMKALLLTVIWSRFEKTSFKYFGVRNSIDSNKSPIGVHDRLLIS